MSCQLVKIFTDHIKNILPFFLSKSGDDLLNHVFSLVVPGESTDVVVFKEVLFY